MEASDELTARSGLFNSRRVPRTHRICGSEAGRVSNGNILGMNSPLASYLIRIQSQVPRMNVKTNNES